MVKRWWLWSLGAVLFLAATFVALAVLLPPSVPYEFLEGQREIYLPLTSAQQRELERMGMSYTMYSFKGDYAAIKRKADKELKAQGYEENGMFTASNRGVMYMKGDMTAPSTPTTGGGTLSSRPEMNMVMIHKDTRFADGSAKVVGIPTEEKGWVTVTVMGTRSKTPFDSLRDWIGL